ncbi:IS110 family transposase [Streptomyces sp. NPDC056716]|uniref:IS110 family transposase n=1 Tax=unclassified Streptomyces TaxID=2593676 RepID=UPI0036B61BF7
MTSATMYAGIDWSDAWLDCAVIRRDGTRLSHTRIVYAETQDPVGDYLDFLRTNNRTRWRWIPTAIESPHLLVVDELLELGMTVMHVDPTIAARARKAASIGGQEQKSDREDAFLLAGMIRQRRFEPLVRSTPQVRALRVLTQAQDSAAQTRARTLLRLRAVLKDYHPAAVSAWPSAGVRHPQARAVLAIAPTPTAATLLSRDEIAAALRRAGRTRTVDDEARRLRIHFRRPALRTHPAIEEARGVQMLAVLDEANSACIRAERLAEQAAEAFRRHPHYPYIVSFPGIGDLLGARILGEIGDVAGRFTARGLCAYAGMTPVTWSSGTVTRTSMRRAVNENLRQALTHAAFTSLSHSPGANAYYRTRRDRRGAHFTSLRAVGARIARALHHCIEHRVVYDEARAWTPGPRPHPL